MNGTRRHIPAAVQSRVLLSWIRVSILPGTVGLVLFLASPQRLQILQEDRLGTVGLVLFLASPRQLHFRQEDRL